MKPVLRVLQAALTGAVFCAAAASAAFSQNFPTKEITLVVPFAAGGSADFVARTVSRRVEQELGRSIVIENKPGANTILGSRYVASAAPDGYTLVLATNGHTTNRKMYRELPFNEDTDFTPIIQIGSTPNVIAVNPSVKARTLKELIELTKSESGGLQYATAGHGSIQHLTGEMFSQLAGLKSQHIAYRGGAPAATDVLAGHVPVLVSGLPPAMAFIEDKRLRALGVTSLEPSPALPDVPTIASQGFPGFESSFWFAVLGPAGMPKDIVKKLHAAFSAALKDEVLQKALAKEGVVIRTGSPEDLEAFMKEDKAKWSAVIDKSGIKPTQ